MNKVHKLESEIKELELRKNKIQSELDVLLKEIHKKKDSVVSKNILQINEWLKEEGFQKVYHDFFLETVWCKEIRKYIRLIVGTKNSREVYFDIEYDVPNDSKLVLFETDDQDKYSFDSKSVKLKDIQDALKELVSEYKIFNGQAVIDYSYIAKSKERRHNYNVDGMLDDIESIVVDNQSELLTVCFQCNNISEEKLTS